MNEETEPTLTEVNNKVEEILSIMQALQSAFNTMTENAGKNPMLKMFIGNLGGIGK